MSNRRPEDPMPATIPSPGERLTAITDQPVETPVTGAIVWHREDLRTVDPPALTAASRHADIVVPLFVFDPGFYSEDGLACDARIRFLHESLADLDEQYAAAGGGLTYGHGDPLAILERCLEAGWSVFASQTPTGRYGAARDERASELGVRFVSGDGLRRGVEQTRRGWRDHVQEWFEGDLYEPELETTSITRLAGGTSIEAVEERYDTEPDKRMVPTGGRSAGRERLESFVTQIDEYPGNISSPLDARDGCSGMSAYLRFGCLSTREVYQRAHEVSGGGRGLSMFTSRLFWNRHYNQKLEDWAGWLDEAVNPEMKGFNRDRYDAELVTAWKEGRTGYPMVDAAMRCLSGTGWLNFRMRAMAASAYAHLLQQPWRLGADWYHHHLIDSDAAINYTQWQSQAGLVGKPSLRLYNPRKQVRDQDPEGEWIRRWVPELEGLPAAHLPRPEKTPPAVQAECGVRIGEGTTADYPRPVVEYEAAKERFWRRYEQVKPAAAARLADPEIARRASLSGGPNSAQRIARNHGGSTPAATQTDLSGF